VKRLLVVAMFVSLALAAGAAGSSGQANGTLQLSGATLSGRLSDVDCPTGTVEGASCIQHTTHGRAPGLGTVSENYVNIVEAPGTPCERWHSNPVLQVAGKGNIDLSAQTAPGSCVDGAGTGDVHASLLFTITGGAGEYVGVSGNGTLLTVGGPNTGHLTDTLSGTLIVSGVSFDTTPPVISGAVSKTVHVRIGVKRVRVSFDVSAIDAVDGAVAASCVPHSRSFFKLGGTRVTCSATDSSANTATARFTVTVKRSH
jgi:HYR domain-containing protein